MRVLHIITSLGTGGAEKLILDTIPLYNKKGIQADVLVLHGSNEPFLKQLQALNCCKVFTLERSYYNPGSIFKIIHFFRQYDLVHTHLFSAQYFTALAKILSGCKTPLVFTEHNTNNRRIENRIYKLPEKIIYSIYSKVICITEEVKKVLKKHINLEEEKLVVIENGVNLATFIDAKPIEKKEITSAIRNSDYLLIQVAGFREQKDQLTLIKAMVHLPENIKLLLVGDGETRSKCEQAASELALTHRVLFLGIRTDIPSLLKTADVVVLSSRYEGLSLSSIEGMASGKPFIASDVPGLTETVKDAGILFPQGDERKLAEEILKLMDDKEYYNRVASSCVERASNYDINTMVDKTIELYNEIVNGKT